MILPLGKQDVVGRISNDGDNRVVVDEKGAAWIEPQGTRRASSMFGVSVLVV
jgi:hypothetical protein